MNYKVGQLELLQTTRNDSSESHHLQAEMLQNVDTGHEYKVHQHNGTKFTEPLHMYENDNPVDNCAR